VTELHEAQLDGLPVAWRSANGAPVLYVHGVPDSSAIWTPFLERGGGVAVDLPGFGRSLKTADFPYSIAGFERFLKRFIEHVELDRFALVVHDWGAAALAFAQGLPERLTRLVIIDGVPLLPGYRWHRIARAWRTPLLGELMMGSTTPRLARLVLRGANAAPLPDEHLQTMLAHFDHGTQRAILKLYRSAPPPVLAAAGERLGGIEAPALVIWGELDPYIPSRFADDYASALGGEAEVLHVSRAGHWPWYDRPDLIERVVEHVAGQ
jgi:pimeloyl-ACP methyl ester carboxylesterase